MKNFGPTLQTSILLLFLTLVGCGIESPPAPVAASDGGESFEQKSPTATRPEMKSVQAEPAKVDPATPEKLKAGLDMMTSRVTATTDAYTKIKVQPDSRFLMHPDMDKSSVMEFDIRDLSSITLSPVIQDFSSVADCAGSPAAGVVDMKWSLDDGAPQTVVIDRHYDSTIAINVGGASKLKLETSKGNDVVWCDWSSIGFIDVKLK